MLLSQYLISVRRLLNDAQANYWQDPELTDYINEGRLKCAVETSSVRSFQEADLVSGTERYLFSALLPNGVNTIDIIEVTLIWGATRVPMRFYPFRMFSAYFRPWTNYKQLPVAFTVYGANTLWVAPVPNQVYHVECDTAVLPNKLATDTDADAIPVPWSDAPKYYAARQAKLRMQQYEEAMAFENLYKARINELNAMYPARVPYIYGSDDLII